MIKRKASSACPDWSAALNHLSDADPVLGKIIARVGPCTMAPRTDYFWALCESIINQQISVAAGRTISKRFCSLFPRNRPTPGRLLQLHPKTLRAAGLSRQKAKYIRGIARAFASNQIPSRRLKQMSDEELLEALIALKGVGRWTAEVFAMFVLNRSDMFPVDDLGLRRGIRLAYGMRRDPTVKQMHARAKAWRPYRSIASWYLWVGQSNGDDK